MFSRLYLFRAGESLGLQEEVGERHEDEETQVGEERHEVPQTCGEKKKKKKSFINTFSQNPVQEMNIKTE